MVDGQRESETSWTALLLDAIARGLNEAPKLATRDGSLGFWLALAKIFPSTKQQPEVSADPPKNRHQPLRSDQLMPHASWSRRASKQSAYRVSTKCSIDCRHSSCPFPERATPFV